MTVVSCRVKERPLHPRRSYFAPAETRGTRPDTLSGVDAGLRAWVEAPGTAPGSDELITTTIYHHSRIAPTASI